MKTSYLVATAFGGLFILRSRIVRAEKTSTSNPDWMFPETARGKAWRNAMVLWALVGFLAIVGYGYFGFPGEHL
jgi:hypothetical protein